jgi:peptide/nickel transport system substrate-binding protein
MAAGGVGVSGLREFEPLVSSGLGRIGVTGVPEPLVAEVLPTVENGFWKPFPDRRMETIWRLRPTARWHDGRPLTAADAQFSMQLELDQEIPMRRTPAWRAIASVETPDPYTITISWKQPYIEADKTFVTALFPKHVFERAHLEQKEVFTDLPYWTTEFVGNGPFRIRELAQGSHVLLEANPEFVLGRPKLDEVEVKFVPDPTTLAASILAEQRIRDREYVHNFPGRVTIPAGSRPHPNTCTMRKMQATAHDEATEFARTGPLWKK